MVKNAIKHITFDVFSFKFIKYSSSSTFLNQIGFIIFPKQIKLTTNEIIYITAGKIISLENNEMQTKNLPQNPIKGGNPNSDKNNTEIEAANAGFHDDIPFKSLIYFNF